MSKADLENSVFSGNDRAPVTWIALPDDLAKWAGQNQELVERVKNALSDTCGALTEEQLWEAIAASCSPEWREARTTLQGAEYRWKDLNSPEKTSLGLIGNALDSDENNAARSQFAFSLACFTIVNEGLRQRGDLDRLLKVMLAQKRMLDRSAEQTHHLQEATTHLSAMSPAPQAGALTGIRDTFKHYAGKLLKLKKIQTPMNAPVPSSPGT
jgi:hypothetical protein